jgi:hypothetical protein
MNPDMPSPIAEREPHFPSLEEIQSEMRRLMGRSDYKEGHKAEDEVGIKLYEVSIVGEDGVTCLYTYRKADGKHAQVTRIEVAYCNGSPNDNDFLPGGYNVSVYDEVAGRWTDTETEKEPLPAPIETPHTNAPETEMTKEKFEGLLKEANVQSVYTLFDIARAQEERCQKTLEMIYTQLLVLNISNSSASKQYRLDTWDPKGKLTEAQFTAFTTQFRELSGIAGAEITKESIKKDLTEIREDIPAQERVRDVIELFDTAESLLETTDIPTLEARERENMGLALTKRATAKAFADRVTTELIKLNRSFGPPATFDDWNPSADLAEDQFKELKRRRKILANAVGSLNALKIRHDLNEI